MKREGIGGAIQREEFVTLRTGEYTKADGAQLLVYGEVRVRRSDLADDKMPGV